MRSVAWMLWLFTWAALGGCSMGSAAPAGETPAKLSGHGDGHGDGCGHGDGHGHGHGDKAAHNFPAVIAGFHEVMAPLWHAEAGAKRIEDTCAAVAAFETQTEHLIAAPVPAEVAGKDAEWTAGVGALKEAVRALKGECATAGRPAFLDQFKAVHEAFHQLIKLVREDKP